MILRGLVITCRQAGAVTICTKNKYCLFGKIKDGVVYLTALGKIAKSCWSSIPAHYPHVHLDAFIIMPDHIHGIIFIDGNIALAKKSSRKNSV
jgi:REP element-mobilizing transposase RayT